MYKGKRVWGIFLAFIIGLGTMFSGGSAAHANYVEVWTESSYVNVFRHTIRMPDSGASIKLSAAKNEYEAAQILIRRDSAFTVNGVSFTNLTSGGNTIASSNLKFQYVEYEYLNANSDQMLNVVRRGPGHYPESLSNNATIAVAANATQPIWIRAYIPKNAAAGVYTGTAIVQTSQGNHTVGITVDVRNVTMPDTDDGAFTSAQWMQFYGPDSTDVINGDNLQNAYGYPRLSADWWTLMDNFAENAKIFRTNSIPVNYVYMLLDGGSTVDANGTYTFNWSVFDQVIQYFIDKGVVKRLEGFTTGVIIDRDANGNPYRNWILNTPNDPKLVNWINQFFPALKAHLESKTLPDGRTWADIWWQHVRDEPSSQAIVDEYVNLADKVRVHWPDIKFGDAINRSYHTQLAGYVSVWVPQSDLFDNNQAFFEARKAAPYNEEVWTYTCAEPRGMYLNRTIDQPVWMNRAMSWYAYNTGTTGYLHYGYNHWDLAMNNQFIKGDLHLVQPDAPNKKLKNSIRLEAQRDGIEDYELLKILEQTNPEMAKGIASSLVTNGTVYSRDIGKMIRMRELLLSAAAGEPIFSIAAGKTATASSQQTGSEASKAVDGNAATKWQSGAAGSQWISVDLGAQYQIDAVKIKWGMPSATSYKIQTSYNGTNWADAATISGGNGGDDFSALNTKGRYLRISATAGSGSSYAMFSLEAAGRALPKANLAGGKAYAKSEAPYATYSDLNNGESTDGVFSTNYMDFHNYGYTGTNDQTKSVDVTVDLGAVQWVNEVKIRRLEESNIRYSPDSVEIFTSKDNVNFTPAGKLTYATSTDGLWYEFTFLDASAKYVKVNFKKTLNTAAFADWMFIGEIEVYGATSSPLANLALGKTYVKSEQPLVAYPDTNGTESTDGILSGDYGDGKSYGFFVPVGTTKTVTITIDLGSDKTVNLVKLRRFESGGSGYGPDNIVVSTSTNAAPNTFVTRGETSWYNGWWYDISFSNDTARYVKLAITKTGVSGADHLFLDEIGVFGTEPAASNLAAGLTYTKSAAPDAVYPDTGNLEATNGVLAGMYTDGKSFGYPLTSGQIRTVSFVFDLGSAKIVNLVKLLAYSGSVHNYKPDSVTVATSLDNIAYTTKGIVSTPVNNWFASSFANTSARYVKLTVSKTYGTTFADWLFLDEMEIYGF
ncbi:glycoside hydrolase domain-containing protein [Paenibacillus nasutitermitis]|uniref:F5/8 type C domain-containing protein n=1 Tax=Paenibacillus nasutitermitis TaxID=1652958 RepID=A0A917E0K4_9BACL|nr:glycoside hydrolase domain-containing protein [Paenibacillus nasutitermitis]GGD88215.1 hypothetical protein GCM10010911_53410 [Paenibacillus nasutitermitis]